MAPYMYGAIRTRTIRGSRLAPIRTMKRTTIWLREQEARSARPPRRLIDRMWRVTEKSGGVRLVAHAPSLTCRQGLASPLQPSRGTVGARPGHRALRPDRHRPRPTGEAVGRGDHR